MSFSGGTYTLPSGNPVVTGTTIQSSWANTTLQDIATALSTAVLKDGTQTITANLPMAGFKFTGLGLGTAAADSARMSQLQGAALYLTGVAGTNTITATASPALAALATGIEFTFVPANTNTGATTLAIDATAATNIFWNGAALVGGEIRQNVPVKVCYDGTRYNLLASSAMANAYAIPDDVLRIQAAGDRTKMMMVSVTGVAVSGVVTMAVPATGGTFATREYAASSGYFSIAASGVAPLLGATQADQETATSNLLFVTPGRQQYHPSAPKAWGMITPAATVSASYPATGVSVIHNGAGDFTVTFGTSMSSTNFAIMTTPFYNSVNAMAASITVQSQTGFRVAFTDLVAVARTDPGAFYYSVYGDL